MVNVDTGGFFLGGLADRQDRLRQIGQQDTALNQGQQGLDLKKQQVQQQQQKQQRDAVKERIATTILQAKTFKQQLINLQESNVPGSAKAAQALEGEIGRLIGSAKDLDSAFVASGGESFGPLIDSALVGIQGDLQKARQSGRVEGVAATAKQQAISGSGLTPGQKEAAGGAKVVQPKEAPATFTPVLDEAGNIVGQKNSKTGKVESDPRTKTTEVKEFKATQREAATFALRMQDANDVISDIETQFTQFPDRFSGLFPQGLKEDDRQLFDQANRNFINAALRRESGASIQPSEFESAEIQYIPQPGDGERVLEQKKRNRQVVTEGLKAEASGAFDELSQTFPSLFVEVGGKRMAVGSIVKNSRGQEGRVNQDGSITVLD